MDYELAIQWLIDAGLVYKVNRSKMLSVPLKVHEDISAFKLFLLDVGLLGAMSQIPPAMLLLPNSANTAKGDFTENYVCCQMSLLRNMPIYYFSKDNSQLELDFVVQIGDEVFPVEVKAEENLQAKSLKVVLQKHENMHGLRFSMSDYRVEERMTNVPLYGISAYLQDKLLQYVKGLEMLNS